MVDGSYHRLDGPAIEYADGGYRWYIKDEIFYNFNDFQKAGVLSDSDIMVLRLKYGEIK